MEAEENFQSTKTGLRKLLRDPDTVLPVLEDAVVRTHEIVTRGWFFLKLYMLSCNDVKVTDTLTLLILKIVSRAERQVPFRKNAVLAARLQDFYRTSFQPLLPLGDEMPSRQSLKQVLTYEAIKMTAAFETHLKCHYVDYVNDACSAVYSRRELRQKHKGKAFAPYKWKFDKLLRDVLTADQSHWRSDPIDHDGVRDIRALALPAKSTFLKNNLRYDIKANPQDYFEPALTITSALEHEERPRLRNLWPLRTTLVPRYIRIDTTVLAHLLLTSSERREVLKSVTTAKEGLWERFFRMDRKVFKRGDFHHMLETDGVGTSLLFKSAKIKNVKKTVANEAYLDELPAATLSSLSDRKVIAIDPGMADLLSCIHEDSTAAVPKRLRYTQNQRRFDLAIVPRRRQLQREKNATVIEDLTVTQWETELSAHNHKTVDVVKFSQYLRAKFRYNQAVAPFYQRYHQRKQRFSTFIATQQSERRFLQDFREKFGTPDQTLVAFGDWEQRQHRKYKEPTKGKGFRRMLRREGYFVALVDEHRTSVQCSHCSESSARCYKFRRRLDPNTKKPLSQRRIREVHGLLVCQTCSRLWNRDVNAPLNMLKIARSCLAGRERPLYLQRGSYISTVKTTSSTVPDIVKPVKIQIRW